MSSVIDIPGQTPVMTLNQVVLFPQAMMPIYIFEPRYKQMLQDALSSNRMFAVAGIDEDTARNKDHFEPPRKTATLGIIRACTVNEDETAQLLLQGLARVEIVRILQEHPYRSIEIKLLPSTTHNSPQQLEALRQSVLKKLLRRKALEEKKQDGILDYLEKIITPDIFLDITIHAMCENITMKQQLLETLDTGARFRLFMRYLEKEIEQKQLMREIRGDCPPGAEKNN